MPVLAFQSRGGIEPKKFLAVHLAWNESKMNFGRWQTWTFPEVKFNKNILGWTLGDTQDVVQNTVAFFMNKSIAELMFHTLD